MHEHVMHQAMLICKSPESLFTLLHHTKTPSSPNHHPSLNQTFNSKLKCKYKTNQTTSPASCPSNLDDVAMARLPLPMVFAVMVALLAINQAMAQPLCFPQITLANEACNRALSESPADLQCCNRLQGIDTVCVCQILSRLPRFIVRPNHFLTLASGTCNVTYSCEGF